MIIRFSGWYSRGLCDELPNFTFVFGDNLLGFGKGGQAIIRGASNAYGVPTKRKPAMTPGSFFVEGNESDLDAVLNSLGGRWDILEERGTVIIPVNKMGDVSLGLERAELRERAPSIYNTIVHHVEEMADAFGSFTAQDADEIRNWFGR